MIKLPPNTAPEIQETIKTAKAGKRQERTSPSRLTTTFQTSKINPLVKVQVCKSYADHVEEKDRFSTIPVASQLFYTAGPGHPCGEVLLESNLSFLAVDLPPFEI